MTDHDFSFAAVALCTLDRQYRFSAANQAMARILGEARDDLIGRSAAEFFADGEDAIAQYYADAAAGLPLADREFNWGGNHYQLSFGPVFDANHAISGLSIAAINIDRRVRSVQRLRQACRRLLAQTWHDPLTGLLNRRGLEATLQRELRHCRRENTFLGLLVLDIDRFKSYNDSFGHDAGDECLRAVTSALRACLRRAGDAAARLGGEEFVILLPGDDLQDTRAMAEHCRQAISRLGLLHPGSPHGHVTVSIGTATVRPSRDDATLARQAKALMKAADRALYRAKSNGRNRIELG